MAANGQPQANGLKGRARVGAERRQAILDAAVEVFGRRGFRGSALAEVADRVGVSAPLVLYHFGSKEALLLAVLEERDRRAMDLVETLPDSSAIAVLRSLVRFAELTEAQPGFAVLHTVLQAESLEADAPAHEYFLRRSRVVRRWLRDVFDRGVKSGELRRDCDAAAAANSVMVMMEGAALLWFLDPKVSLVSLYQTGIEHIISGVQAA